MAEINSLFFALSMITVLFFLLLLIKSILGKKLKENFCVLCLSVSLSWIFLLILYFFDLFNNILIIALLMGLTILGIYYRIENKIKNELKLFRLPFLLSLIFIAYSLLSKTIEIKNILLLSILWIFFLFVYSYRKNKKINFLMNKILECCKKW